MKCPLIKMGVVAATVGMSGQTSSEHPDAGAAVRQLIAAFVDAFNARDAAHLTQLRAPAMYRRSNQYGRIIAQSDSQRARPL
jgi:hypothetical protein